jgi:hypothetical protein
VALPLYLTTLWNFPSELTILSNFSLLDSSNLARELLLEVRNLLQNLLKRLAMQLRIQPQSRL